MSKNNFELPENLRTATLEAWRASVEKALAGKPITSLNSKTYDGITIKPLYQQSDVEGQTTNPLIKPEQKNSNDDASRPWEIISLVDIPSLNHANKQIASDLKGGATGLWLSISADIPYASGTLPITNNQSFITLFNQIDLKNTSLYLSNGSETLSVAAALINYLESKDSDLSTLQGNLGFDPLSLFAALGAYPDPIEEAFTNWLDAAQALKTLKSSMKPFLASGRTWQQAGASEAMELGLSLAAYLSYARALEASGFSTNEAFNAIDLSLTTTSDIFLTTAKFRAIRLLLQKIAKLAGVNSSTKIIAEMSYVDLTERDPEVNMLRATAATVAAGNGNADALVLLPFSSAHGIANAAARRLSLNTQIIAQEESQIGLVSDPAAGSWYIESLTSELVTKAWDIFRQTEKAGGLPKMLKSGAIASMIEAVRTQKELDIATGKKEITGVTIFPNINEKQPDVFEDFEDTLREQVANENELEQSIKLKEPHQGERFKDIQENLKAGIHLDTIDETLIGPASLITMVGPINSRLVASFEGLRSVSDYVTVETGQRPSVYLVNIGKPSNYTARATWAKSYFEAGGIAAISDEDLSSNDALVETFSKSGAKIACLCSSDDIYKEQAVEVARALNKAGANAVYIVARPNLLKDFSQADRRHFHALLYHGTNRVLTLMEAHYLIGLDDETLMV